MKIELRRAALTYQAPDGEVAALRDVTFGVADGEFVSIVGPSGCGKSTLLALIAGIERPSGGEVLVDGEPVRAPTGKAGLMPQRDQLFDWRTIWGNVTLGLEIRHENTPARRDAVRALLTQYRLDGFARKLPNQLSGGMRQRCALIRTLATSPDVLLLDEPFSALDSYLKWDLELKLSDFLENFSGPILWVSHDRGEVFRNCKRVCILDQGASQGTFTLRQLFHEPETEAAARLSGCKNIVEAVPAGSAVTLPAWGLTLNCGKPVPADVRQAGIRARHVMTVPEGTPDAFYCTVERVIQDVFTTIVLLRPEGAADGAPLLRMELERDDWRRLNRPEGLWIAVQPRDVLLLK